VNDENKQMQGAIADEMIFVRRIAAGRKCSENEFYERFRLRVAQTLHKFTKCPPNIHEDLIQITFIQLFRKLHTFKNEFDKPCPL
jgi:DNA-directed RNA polymerase specialized sigma24 family protein